MQAGREAIIVFKKSYPFYTGNLSRLSLYSDLPNKGTFN